MDEMLFDLNNIKSVCTCYESTSDKNVASVSDGALKNNNNETIYANEITYVDEISEKYMSEYTEEVRNHNENVIEKSEREIVEYKGKGIQMLFISYVPLSFWRQ